MLLNLIIFAFASSQVAGTALSPNLQLAASPSNVFRPNPCNQVAARQYEPNPRGCAWFWQCRDNDGNLLEPPQEEKCPYGLHFQASGPSCTYADDIDPICNFDEINRDIPSECAGHRPLPLLPHPFMCNKYLQCFSNLTIERECEPGMYFSFFDNECVPEALANCTIVDDYCKSFEVGRSTHRNAFSCTKFHVCSLCDEHYKIAELECSEPSHQYSDEFGHCTIDSNTNCTATPLDEAPNDLPDIIAIKCPAEFSLEEHPEPAYCHFFFYCTEGRSILQRCSEGTHFVLSVFSCVISGDDFQCPSPDDER